MDLHTPPTNSATRRIYPWPPQPVFTLSYIFIPQPNILPIKSDWSIYIDWECKLCPPASCKTSVMTTTYLWLQNWWNLNQSSPCLMALLHSLQAKLSVSLIALLVNHVYWVNFLQLPRMLEMEANPSTTSPTKERFVDRYLSLSRLW